MYVSISKLYSETPGNRYITEGPFSGEDFRKNFLLPRFYSCKAKNTKLILDFDGTYGYPIGFIDEAFGGLIREEGLSSDEIYGTISFVSYENIDLISDIIKSMQESEKNKQLKLR